MKPNTIELFPDGKIGCYEMNLIKPDDRPFRKTDNLDGFLKLDIEYHKALEAAKRAAIYFKDEEAVKIISAIVMSGSSLPVMSTSYPIPDGYTIEINDDQCYAGCICDELETKQCIHRYALLVPKEKDNESDYPIVDQLSNRQFTKQQSIEKNKWCDSCGKKTTWINGECENYKKKQSIEEAAYTEDQVRTAYKAGILRGLEYKSRGKKKTVYETPNEEQLIQTLKKKL